MNYRDQLKKAVKKIVREVIEEKPTAVSKTWAEMMESLSKEIKKPITFDDAGNYNVCECEPHRISIRPIVHDIFDLQYFKDGVERQKVLFVPFDEVKKYVKEWLNSKEPNYVDTCYERTVDNSKDKQGGKKADNQAEEQNLVNPEKDNKVVKPIKAKPMNDAKDDPTEPMRPVDKFEKQSDHKSKKPSYETPKLPKSLQKLVVKYTKGGKARKK